MMRSRSVRGVTLTEIGLGGAQFGNLYREMPDAVAQRTVDAAWEAGVRYFDTAPHYGLGLSERRLGALLGGRDRDSYVVSTKVGRRLVPQPDGADRLDDEGFAVPATLRREWDLTRSGIRRSLQESLERSGLDRFDVVYLHDAENHWEQALSGAIPALLELRDEGVVRAVGAGMNFAAPLTQLIRESDVDLVMCAGRWTLLEQADELLQAAREREVGVVVAGVYNSGLLAKPRPAPDARYDYAPAPAEILARVHAIADVCQAHGVELPDVAVAFALRHPAVVSVVVGAAGPDQLDGSLRRYHRPIPDSLWSDLAAAGLLSNEASRTRTPSPEENR